jgi:hypothetical protein
MLVSQSDAWHGTDVCSGFLRETPMFWRNAGGFPVLKHDIAWLLSYLGLMTMSGGFVVSSRLASGRIDRAISRKLLSLALLAQWSLLLAVLLITFWNNLTR